MKHRHQTLSRTKCRLAPVSFSIERVDDEGAEKVVCYGTVPGEWKTSSHEVECEGYTQQNDNRNGYGLAINL
jgi:hypothetical protein